MHRSHSSYSLFAYLICIIWLSIFSLQAQVLNERILTVKQHYDALAFQQAITHGDSLIAVDQGLQPAELEFLHKYVGLSRYNIGDSTGARAHFFSVLTLNPDAQLTLSEVSPKIIKFFDKTKTSMSGWLRKKEVPAQQRYVLQRDIRPSAAWRSALIPGWGQFHKQQKTRGVLLGGLFWGSLGTTIFARLRENDRLDAYEQAVNPTDITARYDDYNRWFKTRHLFTYLTLGAWLATVGDAGLTIQPQLPNGRDQQYGLNLSMRF